MAKGKLTDEMCDAICQNIKEHNTLKYSAQKEGITERTFWNWMSRGEEAKSGKYFQFFQAIKKAQEEAKSDIVKEIKGHGKKNWQALAWLLERMYPKEFGRRENVKMEHKGKLKQEIKVDSDLLKDPDYVVAKRKAMDEYYETHRKKEPD